MGNETAIKNENKNPPAVDHETPPSEGPSQSVFSAGRCHGRYAGLPGTLEPRGR